MESEQEEENNNFVSYAVGDLENEEVEKYWFSEKR